MEDQEEYLISYANLKSNIFKFQKKFANKKILDLFYKNEYMGIPQCLPTNIKYFDYSKARFFEIDKENFSKKIFKTKNINYIGNKKFFRYGTVFAYNVFLKKKYNKKLKFYLRHTKFIMKIIKKLKLKNKKVCSMQIRNAPHFGHEAVFRFILDKFDLLVLNPIFGIKKKKDVDNRIITKSLKFMERKYKKIKFLPFWTNFYYGGPREALHHLSMREQLGFKYFYIGRDHAGAENIFKPDAATKTVKIYNNKFKIKSITSSGGYFCKQCNKYLIKGSCKHKSLINISGTEFRSCLSKNKKYKHADQALQKII